jgi:hypothetical protein
MKAEDLAFLRARAAEKNIDLNAEAEAAAAEKSLRHFAIEGAWIPVGGLFLRSVSIDNGPINVIQTGRTGGPYQYFDVNAPMYPLPPWMRMVSKAYSSEGEELSCVSWHSLIVGIIGGWGSFRYESRERVMSGMGNFPALLSLQPWYFAFPSRWFFTGTNGYYWSAPLWLFGHVSSDTSQTFMLLGIPIRYWNTETPGNI